MDGLCVFLFGCLVGNTYEHKTICFLFFFSSLHKELLKEHSKWHWNSFVCHERWEITLIKFAHLCRLRALFSPEKAVHYHFRSSRHHTKKFRFALLMLTILLETDSMVSSLAFFLCHYVVKVFLKLHLS